MNPASERLALNKAMDPNRTEPTQYLIQHGANDNFKRGETNANRHEQMQGRLPDPNEVYLVVNPDGTSRVVNTTAKLEEFYGAVPHATSGQPVNIKWPYGEY
jgi:hypothetical protein